MQCKSLWIKASAKCINVNVNVNVQYRTEIQDIINNYYITERIVKSTSMTFPKLSGFIYFSKSIQAWKLLFFNSMTFPCFLCPYET